MKCEIPLEFSIIIRCLLLQDQYRYIPWPQYRVIVSSFTKQRKSQFTTTMYIRDDITLIRWRPLNILPLTFLLNYRVDIGTTISRSRYWEGVSNDYHLSDSKNLEKKIYSSMILIGYVSYIQNCKFSLLNKLNDMIMIMLQMIVQKSFKRSVLPIIIIYGNF